MNENQAFCPNCGCAADSVAPADPVQNQAKDPNVSDKDWLVTLLLSIFVGGIGVHRFYVGKIGTGILWLLTCGCFGIGALIDLIMIVCGNFKDSDGKLIKRN